MTLPVPRQERRIYGWTEFRIDGCTASTPNRKEIRKSVGIREVRRYLAGIAKGGISTMFRFEHRSDKPISRQHFARRMLRCGTIASGITLFALGVGIAGYHWIGGLGWIDSFLNASMILGGMGPVDALKDDTAKIFAGCYALFSGLAFIALAGFLVAPVAHRILHRFHYESVDEDKDS
jgi:hypothetical protein